MYFFHPGQKLICQRQNLPINDLGALSYFARMGQFSQLCCAIFLSVFLTMFQTLLLATTFSIA
jgi:hypothetical protein